LQEISAGYLPDLTQKEPMSVVFACNRGYLKPTTEAIQLISRTTSDPINVIIFHQGLFSEESSSIEVMTSPSVRVIPVPINSVRSLDVSWLEKYKTKWNPLIFFKLYIPEIFDELNENDDFTSKLWGKKKVRFVLWLDSDTWLFGGLRNIFEHGKEANSPVVSADLNQITFARWTAVSAGEVTCHDVSAGVLLFDVLHPRILAQKGDAFRANAERIHQETQNEYSEYIVAIAREFTSESENNLIKIEYLIRFRDEIDKLDDVLPLKCIQDASLRFLTEFSLISGFIGAVTQRVESLFEKQPDGLLHKNAILPIIEWILETPPEQLQVYVDKVGGHSEEAVMHAGLDEELLSPLTFEILSARANFNPKSLIPWLAPRAEEYYLRGVKKSLQEMALEIFLFDPDYLMTLVRELRQVIILHFDGCLKPWFEEFRQVAEENMFVKRLLDFHHLLQQQPGLTIDDMERFRCSLATDLLVYWIHELRENGPVLAMELQSYDMARLKQLQDQKSAYCEMKKIPELAVSDYINKLIDATRAHLERTDEAVRDLPEKLQKFETIRREGL
jgi:lipopolysaccharide biosynthesis glycosyltransferase